MRDKKLSRMASWPCVINAKCLQVTGCNDSIAHTPRRARVALLLKSTHTHTAACTIMMR
jgi:hypothetical protein